MRDGHVLAQTTHECHLVGVNGMDDATGAEEQTSLEHGVGEQVEHASHVAQLCVVVEQFVMTRQANADGYHHECNLRDGGEGEHALDIGLCTGHCCSIEGREYAYPYHNRQRLRSILNPKREHASQLEYTSDNHRCSMDKCRYRRRAFHSIGKPDVQREHGTLTSTTDEHQHECCGQNHCACSCSLGGATLDEGSCSVGHLYVSHEREAERLGVVAEDENTDEEEHIGKSRHDERFLRSCYSGVERIVESDEQV